MPFKQKKFLAVASQFKVQFTIHNYGLNFIWPKMKKKIERLIHIIG
jgi:hypothetical protein